MTRLESAARNDVSEKYTFVRVVATAGTGLVHTDHAQRAQASEFTRYAHCYVGRGPTQVATLAEEMGKMNIHSIRAYGVVWTFHRRPPRCDQEVTEGTPEVGRSKPTAEPATAERPPAAQSGARCHPPRPMRGCRLCGRV